MNMNSMVDHAKSEAKSEAKSPSGNCCTQDMF